MLLGSLKKNGGGDRERGGGVGKGERVGGGGRREKRAKM